jgi:hypothetical protein
MSLDSLDSPCNAFTESNASSSTKLCPENALISHQSECPVCFGDMTKLLLLRMPCRHEMCLACFTKLREKRCVMCRTDVTDLVPATSTSECARGAVTLHITRPLPRALRREPIPYESSTLEISSRRGFFPLTRSRARREHGPVIIIRDGSS